MDYQNWLQKIAKVIPVNATWNDIASTLNYIADKAQWTLSRVAQLENMPKTNSWYSMTYTGHKHAGGGLGPDFYLNVGMRWSGNMDEQYDTGIGSSKLEFTGQLLNAEMEPFDDENVFETATDIAQYVRRLIDDETEFVEPEPSPYAPHESVPSSPQLVTV